jgi:hypothetical protein
MAGINKSQWLMISSMQWPAIENGNQKANGLKVTEKRMQYKSEKLISIRLEK